MLHGKYRKSKPKANLIAELLKCKTPAPEIIAGQGLTADIVIRNC